MNKRELIEQTIAGQNTPRVPVTMWRHWPGDDQRAADFAASLIQFQATYDWDLMIAAPARTYQVSDHGVQTAWRGSMYGDRAITKHGIQRSLDWTDLRPLDPTRGEIAKTVEGIRLVGEMLQDGTPTLLTVYSPLSQAAQLAGETLLQRNIRRHADRFKSGLNTLTENVIRLFDVLKKTPVSGICYVIDYANYDMLSEAEYFEFGMPYDRKILSEVPERWWFNMLTLAGETPMFRQIADFPVQAVNWRASRGKPGIAEGKSLLRGAVCGGLDARDDLHNDTPTEIRDVIRQSLREANGRRIIIAPEGPVPITTPLSSIRALKASTKER